LLGLWNTFTSATNQRKRWSSSSLTLRKLLTQLNMKQFRKY
jgi:hypothetical protein